MIITQEKTKQNQGWVSGQGQREVPFLSLKIEIKKFSWLWQDVFQAHALLPQVLPTRAPRENKNETNH